jgi:hypothetical protein
MNDVIRVAEVMLCEDKAGMNQEGQELPEIRVTAALIHDTAPDPIYMDPPDDGMGLQSFAPHTDDINFVAAPREGICELHHVGIVVVESVCDEADSHGRQVVDIEIEEQKGGANEETPVS